LQKTKPASLRTMNIVSKINKI